MPGLYTNGEALDGSAIRGCLVRFDGLSLYRTESSLSVQGSPLFGASKVEAKFRESEFRRRLQIERAR